MDTFHTVLGVFIANLKNVKQIKLIFLLFTCIIYFSSKFCVTTTKHELLFLSNFAFEKNLQRVLE